jgi:hypothetical protein
MAVLDQIWLGGNTISDVLIASAMLFHVSSFHPNTWSSEADVFPANLIVE